MKRIILTSITLALFTFTNAYGSDGKATPKDVYDLVLKAYEVVQALGEEALPAFNDPKGEFVYLDTYVYVERCPGEMVAHPFALDKLKGVNLEENFPFNIGLCEAGKKEGGSWAEYSWPKPGETEPARKIAFAIQVEGTNLTLLAGIYSDSAKVDELNQTLR